MIQEFTLHTHNNECRFDGRASAEEMISAAAEKGFKTIGVSNHLICHRGLFHPPVREPMFMEDFNEAEKIYMRHIEILENLKGKYNIDIKISFEADYYPDKEWRNNFEKMLKRLPVDYLVGTCHFLMSKDLSFLCNIYHLKHLTTPLTAEQEKEYVKNYFANIVGAIKSGYYSFMAHLDYCTIFGLGESPEYDEDKYKIIEALRETKLPFEINTSGYNRINRPHPAPWIIKELAKTGDVPVLISDDAHDPSQLGQHFEKAEALLQELNYKPRFTLDMLKKPL